MPEININSNFETKNKGNTALVALVGASVMGVGTHIVTKNKGAAVGAALGTTISVLKDGDALDLVVYACMGGLFGTLILARAKGEEAFLGSACDECKKYPNNGLSFSLDHLKKVEKDIPFFPIEKQALYADAVCKEYVNDPVKLGLLKPVSPRGWNATTIGNLAYIALNSNSPVAREYSKGLLNLYARFKKNKL